MVRDMAKTTGAKKSGPKKTDASDHHHQPRGVHDMGGLPAGCVDRHEHTPTLTERRIDAMMMLLRDAKRDFFTTDENRRTIESMTPGLYEGAEYYERWILALRGLLIEKGVLTEAEIDAQLAQVKARHGAGKLTTGKQAPPDRRQKPAGGPKPAGGGSAKGVSGKRSKP